MLFAVGALTGTIIDAFDTSRPAMRLGAASLCMLSAAVDFVRPRPGDTLEGDELVTAALSFTRPAVLLAGLSVVADHSLGFYALALGVGAAFALFDTAIRDSGPTARLLPWFVRLFAAAAFATGALLVAHAVFDL